MSMAAKAIVAEALTITGSIGVVTGKFNLADAYQKLGYNKVHTQGYTHRGIHTQQGGGGGHTWWGVT